MASLLGRSAPDDPSGRTALSLVRARHWPAQAKASATRCRRRRCWRKRRALEAKLHRAGPSHRSDPRRRRRSAHRRPERGPEWLDAAGTHEDVYNTRTECLSNTVNFLVYEATARISYASMQDRPPSRLQRRRVRRARLRMTDDTRRPTPPHRALASWTSAHPALACSYAFPSENGMHVHVETPHGRWMHIPQGATRTV